MRRHAVQGLLKSTTTNLDGVSPGRDIGRDINQTRGHTGYQQMVEYYAGRRQARHVILLATFIVLAFANLHAQTPLDQGLPDQLSVPKFTIHESPIGLRGDVRPRQYLGAVGRASAWLGWETGEAELWVHPLKLANDFRIDFQIPDYRDPVKGRDVARTVEIRPEITTITYTHATFTVRQHILAPLDRPGLLVLLDVDTFTDLDLLVSFKTVFQYAWPGAFGGQYTVWNEDVKAFLLSESIRQRNAFIGSPWSTSATTHPAHALPDAPSTFIISVDRDRAVSEFIPIAIAAGIGPRDSVLTSYEGLIARAESLYQEKRRHVTNLLATTTTIDTPDDELDLAFEWSKINLAEQLVCNPDLGCGFVAGWGTSGQSTRPGFGWFFGGDAAITSFAMDATGQWEDVATELRFLAGYQRDDGKITHEISQAAGRIPWFTEFPYAYYHADTTPYWIVAVWRYWRASGDNELVRDLWPAIVKAFEWCLTVETDGDGIIENTTGGLGAIEVGAIGDQVHQDIYLAAVWISSLQAIGEMSDVTGRDDMKHSADSILSVASSTLNERYWRESEGHHAFGILQSGATNDNLTVWPATAAAFKLLNHERALATLKKLGTTALSSDWGARMLSTHSPLYEPLAYNSGAVWPFVTGFVSWGQYNYKRPWAGYPLIHALKQMMFDWAPGRHPELLSGDYYRPLDTAVPHQFFATSMLTTPVILGMLGWEPDAPKQRAVLAPQVPPQWHEMDVHNLRVGNTALTVSLNQQQGRFRTVIKSAGSPVTLKLTVPVPPGARDVVVASSNRNARTTTVESEQAVSITVVTSEVPDSVSVGWTGGLSVEHPAPTLDPGQGSDALKVLDFDYVSGSWDLLVEGTAGRTYDVRIYGESFTRVAGGNIIERQDGVTTIAVTVPVGNGRKIAPVTLSR
jgi:glycogen debranching enzyme